MRRRLVAIAACAAAWTAGCAPTPVEVDLAFPREENFLYTDFGHLLVYPVDAATGLEACPALLAQVSTGSIGEPVFDSDRIPICDFRAGGVSLGDVPAGPHAYVVLASDEANNLLLTGCRVAEVYVDAPQIEVFMFPTADYADVTDGRPLSCGDAADKCAGGCR